MWTFIRKFLTFRAAQGTTRSMARMMGLGRVAAVAGLVGGIMALRRHRA
jgi:hypothetical protein